MANKRMIRDWTDSEVMDGLTQGAEIFFTRLIMKADDYGNYTANVKLIKAALFPLKETSFIEIGAWITECWNAGLIGKYTIEGKEYIHIQNFGQKLRRMKNTFPPPVDGQVRTSDGQVTDKRPPELEEEVEEKKKIEVEDEGASAQVLVWPTFEDFWNLYDKKIDRPKCLKKWEKIKQGGREEIMLHVAEYVKATPDKVYRKHPATYLNNQSWENEIITNGRTDKTQLDRLAGVARLIAAEKGSG